LRHIETPENLPRVIGVVAKEAEHPVVREFFELFKTPWEFYDSNRDYDVVLCLGGL